jgi:ATP-dependent helicase/nuclease subunit A
MADIRSTYMLDKEYGFATKYVDPEKRISYPSLPQLAFKRKKKMEMLAEEMRVLYVAFTRAKEKLYLVGTLKDAEKNIEQWSEVASHSEWLLMDFKRAAASSYLEWLGPSLYRHQDCSGLTRSGTDIKQIPEDIRCHSSSWKITMMKAEEIKQQILIHEIEEDHYFEKVQKTEPVPVESIYKEEITSRLTWEYAHPNATHNRSKQSVSELKRAREMSDEQSGTDLVRKFKKSILKRPKFMQEKSMSPTERGTAMHMVMQHVDLTKEVSVGRIKEQVESMVINELLTPEQAKIIDAKLITQFFTTELGKRYFQAEKLYREVPFTLSLPAQEVYPAWKDEDESIFVQGVIDCIFEDEKGLVLIDYKTDGITDRFKGGIEQAKPILEERYRMQIDLYTKAIERIWKRKVAERYLFFFDGAHMIKL